jgi:hypothetical protein
MASHRSRPLQFSLLALFVISTGCAVLSKIVTVNDLVTALAMFYLFKLALVFQTMVRVAREEFPARRE